MPIYDFRCPEGHTTEWRVPYGTPEISCPLCGQPARREAVYQNQFVIGETCAKNMRRAEVPLSERRYGKKVALFQEASQEINYQASQVEKETGVAVETPNYYQMGKAKAGRVRAGLEAPPGGS